VLDLTADACALVSAESEREASASVTVLVCRSCRLRDGPPLVPRPGAQLLQALEKEAENTGIAVKGVGCLGNCSRGISVAMLRDGGWSYLFGELEPSSAGDILAGAKLFTASGDPFMPYRARPEALKRGLIARIPTSKHLKDLP
jgi:predicted metal-binding protein